MGDWHRSGTVKQIDIKKPNPTQPNDYCLKAYPELRSLFWTSLPISPEFLNSFLGPKSVLRVYQSWPTPPPCSQKMGNLRQEFKGKGDFKRGKSIVMCFSFEAWPWVYTANSLAWFQLKDLHCKLLKFSALCASALDLASSPEHPMSGVLALSPA